MPASMARHPRQDIPGPRFLQDPALLFVLRSMELRLPSRFSDNVERALPFRDGGVSVLRVD
jgi:hypothetical protein